MRALALVGLFLSGCSGSSATQPDSVSAAAASPSSRPSSSPTVAATATIAPTATPTVFGGFAGGYLTVEFSETQSELRLWSQDGGQSYSLWSIPRDQTRGGYFQASWSPNGDRIAVEYWQEGTWLVMLDLEGQEIFALPPETGQFEDFSRDVDWSPDGTTLAYVGVGSLGYPEIFLMDADGGNPRQLTTSPTFDYSPLFSPDGERILWSRQNYLYLMDLGTQEEQALPIAESIGHTWSPDGAQIAFSSNSDLYVMDVATHELTRLTFDGVDFEDGGPQYTSNGRWLLFSSVRADQLPRTGFSLYLVDLTSMGEPELIGFGFVSTRWTPDGTRIVFLGWPPEDKNRTSMEQYYAYDPDSGQLEPIQHNGRALVYGHWNPSGVNVIEELIPSAAVVTSTPSPLGQSSIDLKQYIAGSSGLVLGEDGGLHVDQSTSSEWYGHEAREAIPLDGPFTVRVRAEFEGDNAYISLNGALSGPGAEWWQGMQTIYIGRRPEGNAFVRIYDGQQEESQPDIELSGRIGNGELFTIEFLDANGTEFEIYDEDGQFVARVVVPELWKINLPEGVFSGQVLYPGVLVGQGSSLSIDQFEIEFPQRE